MIMKKLIAIAVVFALVAGGVFAADISATVFGGVRVVQTDSTEGTDIGYDAGMSRMRLEGSGEAGDNFGAWYRFDPASWSATGGEGFKDWEDWSDTNMPTGASFSHGVSALAWWKPIDQFKMTIGGNPDGLYAKEGYSGWMFYQMPCDVGIANNGNVWGGGYIPGGIFRDAFYGGFGDQALMLDIMPVEMFAINLILPFFDWYNTTKEDKSGKALAGVFKHMTIQLDVNMDFGNIALTFGMDTWQDGEDEKITGKAFLYFGLSSIDNLDLAVSLGFPFPTGSGDFKTQNPIAFGVAAKYDISDAFGLKARILAEFAGKTGDEKDPFVLGADIMPYYAINDNLKAFFSLGLGMAVPDEGDSVVTWHINPYLQVGAEWGPTFYAGIRAWSMGKVGEDEAHPDKAVIHFEIPIGIQVSF
jgi:hypothetical protein